MASTDMKYQTFRKLAYFEKILSLCSIGLMFFLCVCIFMDAVLRAFGHPTIWVFETSTYAFILIGFLGNALAIKKSAHFRMTVLRDLIPSLRWFFDFLSDLSIIGFGILLVLSGAYFTNYLWVNDVRSSTLLEAPLWLPSISIPLGGLALSLQTILSRVERILFD